MTCLSIPLLAVRKAARKDRLLLKRIENRVRSVLDVEAVQIAFQPILDINTGQMVGVEALARFTGDPVRGPDLWFAEAATVGLGVELELLCTRRALAAAAQLNSHLEVNLNLSAAALLDPRTVLLLMESGVPTQRITIEITEHVAVVCYARLQVAIDTLRRLGVRLAVDDAGSGYACFAHILALAPNCIKIDRQIIAGLDRDLGRRALVRAIVGFAAELSICVVAEGVETPSELATIKVLGVDRVQGYLTGRPTLDPAVWATWTDQHICRSELEQLVR